MSFDRPEIISSPTGAKLALRYQAAGQAQPALAVIQICHGLAEHSLRYQAFAQYLSAHGFHVYAHDHRGHGLTKAADAPLGRFALKDGALKVLQDTAFIEQTIRARHPGLPLLLFGHSMGGLISLAGVQHHICTPDAAAICNSNLSTNLARKTASFLLKAERMYLGSDVPSQFLPQLTFRNWAAQIKDHQTPFDWLSHDHAEVAFYNADPLCGFDPSVSMWLDIFRLMEMGTSPAPHRSIKTDLPLFLQGGGQDPATNHGKAIFALQKRLEKTGYSRITKQIYADMRHESLHETARLRFMQDFTAWATSALR